MHYWEKMNKKNIFGHYKSKRTSKEIEQEMYLKYHIKPTNVNHEITKHDFELKNLYFKWRRKKHEESIRTRN